MGNFPLYLDDPGQMLLLERLESIILGSNNAIPTPQKKKKMH